MKDRVSFQSADISFKLLNQSRLRGWIKKIAALEGREIDALSYIFCSDRYLLKINQKYLNHKTFTDIITFDLSDGIRIDGEIYISIERVKANASNFENPFAQELRRVMIHGVLHLCGYPDKKQQEKATMRRKEEACLSLY